MGETRYLNEIYYLTQMAVSPSACHDHNYQDSTVFCFAAASCPMCFCSPVMVPAWQRQRKNPSSWDKCFHLKSSSDTDRKENGRKKVNKHFIRDNPKERKPPLTREYSTFLEPTTHIQISSALFSKSDPWIENRKKLLISDNPAIK